MRSLLFLLFLVIFCSLQMTSTAPLAADVSDCCMEFTDVKIPVKQVKSYYWTSSNCPRQAVVFQMISGRKICVDPETTWLSGHVAKVDQRTKHNLDQVHSSVFDVLQFLQEKFSEEQMKEGEGARVVAGAEELSQEEGEVELGPQALVVSGLDAFLLISGGSQQKSGRVWFQHDFKRMRSLMFLLVLVIFCSLQMTSSAPIALDAANSKCCMEFTKVKIPVRQVKSYSWTSKCKHAIVFHMISGKEFCVDPETTWVNSHVAKVDQRKTSAATKTITASTAKTQSPTV
ncbi:uncharacterized protein [Chanodichthys erythropterus]|uniref:uncharacterized protein n=1 Tax=Chanodichthys erythropterus TaxID=933992 RepID=UPI00351E724A